MSNFTNTTKYGCGTFIGIGLLLMIILLPLSIKELNDEEYAIMYNPVTRHYSNKVYEEGRHAGPPGFRFIVYPKKFIHYEPNIMCLSKDGLSIELKPSIQYQYRKDRILAAFEDFGERHRTNNFIKSHLDNTIRDSCSNFTAFDFYTNRVGVELDILNRFNYNIDLAEQKNTTLYVTKNSLVQLNNIQLPKEYLDTIEEIQKVEQNIDVALIERTKQLTFVETQKQKTLVDMQILENKAVKEAEGIIFTAEQNAAIKDKFWEEKTATYISMVNNLNLNTSELVDYLYASLPENLNNPTIIL